ncbi:Ras GTPase-activating-like protein IQGAP1 [Amphibalanus amphitrite]|nr:Ras GTPase-activating-like protein IQGAP1 [Amphibalanus amphitrite]
MQPAELKGVQFEISPLAAEGTFQVNAKLLGVQLKREEISLQELLQLQYGGVSSWTCSAGGLKGGKRGGNRTGTSAAIFSLEAADVGVAYSGQGRDESRGEEIGALGV